MKKYIIIYENSYKRAVTLTSYTVEAESEKEALKLVENGEGEQTTEEFLGGQFQSDAIKDIIEL